MPPPPPNSSQSMVSHDLMTVAAYADTLDALPLDLTRGFSDLRELDAVLSASLIHLTGAIKSLTSVLLNPNAEPGERLAILREVAEYAQRFKLGGEDKIRVVGGVCEGVISHQTHLSNLLSHSSLLTARPPSPPGSSSTVYLPPTTTGKRTRTGANASLTTPARKVQRRDAGAGGKSRAGSNSNVGKGAAGDEWDDGQRSPQKGGAKKALARGRKVESNARGTSPAPSNLSQSFTASHHNPSPRPSNSRASSTLPSSVYPPSDAHSGQVTNEHLNLVDSVTPGGHGVGEKIDDLDHVDSLANGGDGMDQGGKGGKGKGRAGAGSSRRHLGVDEEDDEGGSRRGGARGSRNTRGGTALSGEGGEDSGDEGSSNRRTTSRRQTRLPAGGRDDTPSTAHPNHSDAESSRLRQSDDEGSDEDGAGGLSRGGGAQGTGDTTMDSAGTTHDDPETGDKKVYCYCNGVSYGEMIGCDDDDCPIEWFHLDCLDLTEPPEGSWLCPDCTVARAAKGRKGRK